MPPPPPLDQIKTIVIVMMENRSFDHMLGYLSLDPYNRADVDGLSVDPNWVAKYTNIDQGTPYPPFLNPTPYTMPGNFDPPHERQYMAGNLGPMAGGIYPMNGFVSTIPPSVSTDPAVRKLVMSYFGADQVPMSHFFSENFTICDRWFSAIPAGTQANRLMSMSGFTRIDVNHDILLQQDLLYDWLTRHNVTWRVYHQGIPFFTMMPNWVMPILGSDLFRSFDNFASDLMNTPPANMPQVIFVEPIYQDAPHLGFATDEHAPSGVSNGQGFLLDVYNALANSPYWQNSLMIVDYDENGAFFDHVSPPMIPTTPPPNEDWEVQSVLNPTPFVSLGPRIPAYVISPFVKPRSVFHGTLDHTSVLKFLAEKFDPNKSHSAVVDARPVQSLSAALDFTNPITNAPVAPSLDDYLSGRGPAPAGVSIQANSSDLQTGFQKALKSLKQNGADATHPKFGQLIAAVDQLPA